jgi:hypothetical protein
MHSILRNLKITKAIVLAFIFIALWTSITAQEGQNRSEKYADAYKKYVNATCPIPKDSIQHFVYFSRDCPATRRHL